MAPPNSRRHSPSLTTTTGAPFSRVSSGVNARPMAGCTPATLKKSLVTPTTVAKTGALPPRTTMRPPSPWKAASPAKLWLWACQSRKFGDETLIRGYFAADSHTITIRSGCG